MPNNVSSRKQFSTLDERFLTILKKKTGRWKNREALRMNILAAVQISDTVKTMLGPKGMNKTIDRGGIATVCSDADTFLAEAGVTNPVGRMLVDVARVQRDQIGDGTTSVILLTGALLDQAEKLVEMGVHPIIICSGYARAKERILSLLDELATCVDPDQETLEKVASATARNPARIFKNIIAQSVLQVTQSKGSYIDPEMIKIQPQKGRSITDTELVKGVVLKSERLSRALPERVSDAKIALLDFPVSSTSLRTNLKIEVSDPASYTKLRIGQDCILRDLVDKIHASGATAVFDQKGFQKEAWRHFASKGIFVAKRVTSKDMKLLLEATGGMLTSTVDELSGERLGFAKIVEERKLNDERLIMVEGCANPRAVTLLARASTDASLETLEKDLKRSIQAVSTVVEDPRVLYGGGATEMQMSKRLREYSSKITSREKLAVEAFANALEKIPLSLMRNSGVRSLDLFLRMKTLHSLGKASVGFDAYSMDLVDTTETGLFDPYRVKAHIIKLAVDSAISILRIDDVIIASKITTKEAEDRGYEKATH